MFPIMRKEHSLSVCMRGNKIKKIRKISKKRLGISAILIECFDKKKIS